MSSVLLRSARPAVRSVLLPATRMALVPARRLANQSQQNQQQQQQQGNTWQTPVSAPLKEAAAEAAADVKHVAETVKDAAKLKVRQMQNNGTIEEAKMKAAELGVKAKNVLNSAAEQLGDIIDPTGAGKRKFHTSRQVAGHKTEDAFNELVDDATRLGQKAKNRTTQAGAEVKEQVQSTFVADDATRLKQKVENRATQVGAEIKEQGQSLLHSAKKTAKKVSAAVSDAVDSVADAANTPSQPGQQQQARQQPGQQPGQQTRQFSTKTTDSGAPKKPVPTASKPVQQAHDSPELSTSKRPGHVIGGQGESSQGEKMEGVKKSLFDGPQTMPQGVGKRAVDENGKPLETGAPRT